MAEKLTAPARSRAQLWVTALAAALLATGLGLALGVALQLPATPAITAAAPGAATAGAEQCYVWVVFNATGVDADGLRVRLAGVQTVTSVYSGDANPLGSARPGGGYDASSASYMFDLGQNAVTVAAGESVQVGVCTPDRVASAHMQWLAGASAVGDEMHPLGVTWDWLGSSGIQVRLKNSAATSVTVFGLRLLAPGIEFTLDEVEESVVSNLGAAAELEEPMLLGPGGEFSQTLALVAEGPGRNEPVVLAVEWVAEDDLATSAAAYIATRVAADRVYLPFVLR